MKSTHLLILPAVLALAACGGRNDEAATGAYATPAPVADTATDRVQATATGTSFTATVVNLDPANKSVTLRELGTGTPAGGTGDLSAGDRTLRAEGEAATALSGISVGDRVTVVCTPSTATGITGTMAEPGATSAAPGTMGGAEMATMGAGGLGSCASIVSLIPSAPAE